ncbi:hypothetical protein OKB57_25215 (plasmid) [Serratia marcescens]|uniref:hypothetical protein n=1 Tax=Serratia marcescens TaxID=615 RepID=UPI0022249BCD|nr:hypothetical protein [Serratia marcescens]UYY70135.1 hypothetical protein OKB57_25215 [Serratia marcescens]
MIYLLLGKSWTKQKKERETLITENALAEVKHQAALEEGEGEQSPSTEEAQAVSVDAVPDDVLMGSGSLNKANSVALCA